MRAIILSAGQGKRLRPLTRETPKCLLPVLGQQPVLELQLRALAAAGVSEACVVVGFGAERVEGFLRRHSWPGIRVRTLFNPFFDSADNLVTCGVARAELRGEFLLLNGDTLFEPAVVDRLRGAPPAPLTLAIDQKPEYDADDMKVSVDSRGRLRAVGKTLHASIVNGESIGVMRFSGEGPRIFRRALDAALGEPGAPRAWYLSVVNRMAQCARVSTQPLESLWWEEIDSFADLERVRRSLAWIGDRRLGFDPSSAPRAAAAAGTRDRSEACESAC